MRAWRETREGVRLLRYPQRAAAGLAGYLMEYPPSIVFSLAWLLWARSRGPVHIIHGCNPPDLFFLLGLVGRSWGAHYVFDQHDANPELSVTKWGNRRLGRLLRGLTGALEAASYRTASLVIVPNGSYARIARSRGRVPDERLAIVRNAPPAGHFAELAAHRRPDPGGPFRIGYLGVMGSQDGVEILVDAVAALRRRLPQLDLRVDLVGDGEARPRLERKVAEAGLQNEVIFHGYMQSDAFVPLLARTHVCVSPDPPTPFNQVSTMTKVVEYLAMGRPVVTFDLVETRQLVGAAGRIVTEPTAAAMGDALAELAGDGPALAELTAAAASRFAELDLNWEGSAARMIAAYDAVLAVP